MISKSIYLTYWDSVTEWLIKFRELLFWRESFLNKLDEQAKIWRAKREENVFSRKGDLKRLEVNLASNQRFWFFLYQVNQVWFFSFY